MCLPNFFSRKQRDDKEEIEPQPSPAEPTGRRTAEATARLSNSKFRADASPRPSSDDRLGPGYAPGGYASSPSGGDGSNGGLYGGIHGGVYSGVNGGPNGGVSGGVYGGVYGGPSGGALGTAAGGGYGTSPGGTSYL
ncbi:hypothetical protein FALCPG4_18979 [Fusarium falciforme]